MASGICTKKFSRKVFVKIYSLGGYQEANKVVELSAGAGKGGRPWPTFLPIFSRIDWQITSPIIFIHLKIYHIALSLKVPGILPRRSALLGCRVP